MTPRSGSCYPHCIGQSKCRLQLDGRTDDGDVNLRVIRQMTTGEVDRRQDLRIRIDRRPQRLGSSGVRVDDDQHVFSGSAEEVVGVDALVRPDLRVGREQCEGQ